MKKKQTSTTVKQNTAMKLPDVSLYIDFARVGVVGQLDCLDTVLEDRQKKVRQIVQDIRNVSPRISGLGVVCFHSSSKHPDPTKNYRESPAFRIEGKRTVLDMDNVVIDGAGIGLDFGEGTCEHRLEKISIKSPRTAGMRFARNIPDCRIGGIHISGVQHEDYVKNPPPEQPLCLVGFDGLPISMEAHGRTLIEKCATGINTGTVLNQYFADLMLEVSGTGIVVGSPHEGPDYLNQLQIGRLHMQACAPKAVAWRWGGGFGKTYVRLGMESYSRTPNQPYRGDWASDGLLRPAQVVLLKD